MRDQPTVVRGMPSGSPVTRAMRLFMGRRESESIQLLVEHLRIEPGNDAIASMLGRILDTIPANHPEATAARSALAARQAQSSTAAMDGADLEFAQAQAPSIPAFKFDEAQTSAARSSCSEGRDGKRAGFENNGHTASPTKPLLASPPAVEPAATAAVSKGDAEPEVLDPSVDAGDDIGIDHGLLEDVLNAIGSFEDFGAEYTPSRPIDWATVDIPEDGSDAPEAEPPAADRLSVEQRAEQLAATIASRADWDPTEAHVLTTILAHHHNHARTYAALTDLILLDSASAEELALAHELREMWATGGYSRRFIGNKALDGAPRCPWFLALHLIRELRAEDVEELLFFVEDCFQDWSDHARLVRAYPCFTSYLDAVVNTMSRQHVLGAPVIPPSIDFSLFPDEDGYYDTWGVGRVGRAFGYHVIGSVCG